MGGAGHSRFGGAGGLRPCASAKSTASAISTLQVDATSFIYVCLYQNVLDGRGFVPGFFRWGVLDTPGLEGRGA